MLARTALVLTALIASACADEGTRRFTPLPDAQGKTLLLFAWESGGARAFLIDLREAAPGIELDAPTKLAAIVYDSAFDDLGEPWVPGEIALEGTGLGHAPPVGRAFVRDATGRWTPTDRDKDVAGVRLAGSPCLGWDIEAQLPMTARSPGESSVRWIRRLPDGRLIAAQWDEAKDTVFWTIEPREEVPRLTPIRAPAFGEIFAKQDALIAADGTLWLPGDAGVFRAELTGATLTATRAAAAHRANNAVFMHGLAGRPQPGMLYVGDQDGGTWRWDGGSELTELHRVEYSGWRGDTFPRVDDRGAFSVSYGSDFAVHFEDAGPRVERIFDGDAGTTRESLVVDDPPLRVVGGDFGQFALDRGDGWEAIKVPDFDLALHALSPGPRGFFFFGPGGYIGQYVEGFGFCPTQPAFAGSRSAMIEAGGRYFITPLDTEKGITVVRPRSLDAP